MGASPLLHPSGDSEKLKESLSSLLAELWKYSKMCVEI